MVQAQVATLGIVPDDGGMPAIPLVPLWECADCEDRQPLDGELEN
jgi:hypothetical protein